MLDRVLLLVLVGWAAAARLYLGSQHFVGYDGYWHVFIAGREDLRAMWAECLQNAHPPLYFLLLRASMKLGPSLLAYRLPSIAAGVAAVPLAWMGVRRLTSSRVAAALTAAVMACAGSAVLMSCEVRSYMLAIAFLLAALIAYPALAGVTPDPPTWKTRAAFAGAMSAALLSHYGAAFCLMACLGAPFVLAAFAPGFRGPLASRLRRAWAADLATAAGPALVLLALALVHVRALDLRFNHVRDFYYDPARQAVGPFLLQNLSRALALFSPVAGRGASLAFALTLVALALALLVAARAGGAALRRALPAALLLLTLCGFAGAAVRGLYPLGGELRHQYFLFPFVLLTIASGVDAALARRWPRWEPLLVVTAAAVPLALSMTGMAAVRFPSRAPFASEVEAWARAFPTPGAVYVDQFNLIGLFSQRDRWSWREAAGAPDPPYVERFEVSRPGERMIVLRDRKRWNVDFHRSDVYQDIRRVLASTGLRSTTVFAVRQEPRPRNERQAERFRREIETRAGDAGLQVEGLTVDGENVYGRFHLIASGRS